MLKMMSRVSVELVVFVAIITSIVSATSAASEDSWFAPEFSVLQKVYDDCLDKDDFTGCLKGRALAALNKAISQVCAPTIKKKNQHISSAFQCFVLFIRFVFSFVCLFFSF